jgi:hypothetical protein
VHLDVRIPIGILFSLVGAVIAAYGVMTLGDDAARPTGIAINLVWGLVMLAFGATMLALAGHAARRMRKTASHQPSTQSSG